MRRQEGYTPSQSLRQSTHNAMQSEVKLLRESIVRPVDKAQSESIINKVSNISVRFANVSGGRPSPIDYYKSESIFRK